jgi:hypothetical protein
VLGHAVGGRLDDVRQYWSEIGFTPQRDDTEGKLPCAQHKR